MKIRAIGWMAILGFVCAIGCSDPNRNQTAADRTNRPSDASRGTADRGALAGADHPFVMRAAQDGIAAIEMSKLAQEHGSAVEVEELGRRLGEAHRAMKAGLKQAAQSGIHTMPTELPAGAKSAIDKLSKLNGTEFDREFLSETIEAHRQAIELFQKEATGGESQSLRDWASSQIPKLQEQLKAAQNLQSGLIRSGPKS